LTATETTVPEATEPPTEEHVDLDGFAAALDGLVRDVDGTVAVSLMSISGDVLWEMNPYEPMEAASLYKLAIMVEVYRRQEEGGLTFDDTVELTCAHFNEGEDSFLLGDIGAHVSVEALVTSMITLSSNVAAYALLELVGSESVNATMADLGLDGIEIRWSPLQTCSLEPEESVPEVETQETQDSPAELPLDETQEPAGAIEPPARWLILGGMSATVRGEAAFNVVRSSDLARLFVLMLEGEVVNADASQEMLDLLGHQQIYGGLSALLPEGVVAHKTGYLEDGIVNDAGVIYTPSGPLVAVVLTESVGEAAAYDIASQIGLLVYQLGSD
jgi:beta-lactamase class A